MIEAYEQGTAPAFELYALGLKHKHVPEIMAYTGLTRRPLFVPAVGNFKQGMLVQVPLHLDLLPGQPSAQDLHNALARMSWESASPLMGSSANVSLTGSKFSLAEVQDSLKDGCDIVLDYGPSPYANPYAIGSTIIELPSWRVLRWGGCFEQQAALVLRHFGVALPARPAHGPLSLV